MDDVAGKTGARVAGASLYTRKLLSLTRRAMFGRPYALVLLRQLAYLENYPPSHGHPLPPWGRLAAPAGPEVVAEVADLTTPDGSPDHAAINLVDDEEDEAAAAEEEEEEARSKAEAAAAASTAKAKATKTKTPAAVAAQAKAKKLTAAADTAKAAAAAVAAPSGFASLRAKAKAEAAAAAEQEAAFTSLRGVIEGRRFDRNAVRMIIERTAADGNISDDADVIAAVTSAVKGHFIRFKAHRVAGIDGL